MISHHRATRITAIALLIVIVDIAIYTINREILIALAYVIC